MKNLTPYSKICVECAKKLPEGRNRNQIYCSKKCQMRAWIRVNRPNKAERIRQREDEALKKYGDIL